MPACTSGFREKMKTCPSGLVKYTRSMVLAVGMETSRPAWSVMVRVPRKTSSPASERQPASAESNATPPRAAN